MSTEIDPLGFRLLSDGVMCLHRRPRAILSCFLRVDEVELREEAVIDGICREVAEHPELKLHC